MKKFYALSFALIILSTVSGQTKRLAVIGSSTSACFGFTGINDPNCYINQVVAYYATQGITVDLRNLALSGSNVYNGMPDGYPEITIGSFGHSPNVNANISEAVTPTLNPAWSPDVIIVNYPSNEYQHLTLTDIMIYFRTIKKFANDAGKVCFITSTQPRTVFDAPTRAKLKEIKDSVLFQFGTFALDFWTTLADADGNIVPMYGQGDGTHLNTTGHTILAQRVQAANIFAASLPVRITAFATKTRDKNIELTWSVADEMPGTTYKVQRSSDGLLFQTISEVQGRGTSSKQSYQYIDKTVVKGSYFYRLEITEPGKRFYSRIEKGSCENKIAVYNISTTGSNTTVKIVSSERGTVQLRLIGSTGVIMRSYSKSVEMGTNIFNFSHTALSKGVYWIESFLGKEKICVQPFISQ